MSEESGIGKNWLVRTADTDSEDDGNDFIGCLRQMNVVELKDQNASSCTRYQFASVDTVGQKKCALSGTCIRPVAWSAINYRVTSRDTERLDGSQ